MLAAATCSSLPSNSILNFQTKRLQSEGALTSLKKRALPRPCSTSARRLHKTQAWSVSPHRISACCLMRSLARRSRHLGLPRGLPSLSPRISLTAVPFVSMNQVCSGQYNLLFGVGCLETLLPNGAMVPLSQFEHMAIEAYAYKDSVPLNRNPLIGLAALQSVCKQVASSAPLSLLCCEMSAPSLRAVAKEGLRADPLVVGLLIAGYLCQR